MSTTRTARGLAAASDGRRTHRALSAAESRFLRAPSAAARAPAPAALRTGSTVSLVERQVEVLREQKTDARAEARRIRRRRARQRRPRRPHPPLHAPPAARAERASPRSARSKPACARTSTPSIPCCCSSAHRVAAQRRARAASCACCRRTTRTSEVLRSAVRHRQAALRPGARFAARVPVRPRGERASARWRSCRWARTARSACSRSAARSATASIRA